MEERLLWWGATPLVTADRETGTARMGAMRSFLYTFVIYIYCTMDSCLNGPKEVFRVASI